jgi:hypothetical protein
MEHGFAASEIDTSRPHPARMYDAYLGGKDNYAADREAVRQVLRTAPEVRDTARANRAFLQRAVRFLAGEAGIRQFLDIGTGIPAAGNVHEVAGQVAPGTRVSSRAPEPEAAGAVVRPSLSTAAAPAAGLLACGVCGQVCVRRRASGRAACTAAPAGTRSSAQPAAQGIRVRRSPIGISANPAAKEMPISLSERLARESR